MSGSFRGVLVTITVTQTGINVRPRHPRQRVTARLRDGHVPAIVLASHPASCAADQTAMTAAARQTFGANERKIAGKPVNYRDVETDGAARRPTHRRTLWY
jgi:hypothetical protein